MRQGLLIGLFLIAAVILRCGSESVTPVLPPDNGVAVRETTEYPAVVRVFGSRYCTGSLLNAHVVLTASHCLQTGHDAYILTDRGTKYPAKSFYLHGPGTETDGKDIALLDLTRDVVEVSPNAFIKVAGEITPGQTVRLVGWGCNESGALKKRAGTNVVFRVNDFIELVTPLKRGLIGSENRVGSCEGDSGGPALVEKDGAWNVVALIHSALRPARSQVTFLVNLLRAENRTFLSETNARYKLQIP